MTDDQSAGPPEVPDVPRRTRLYPFQWIPVLLLLAIPIAAVAGAFGERSDTMSRSADGITVEILVPVVLRYRQTEPLRVTVVNTTTLPIDSLTVEVDTSYVTRFSDVSFTPSAVYAFVVQLPRLEPGASTTVFAELTASDYGRHRGDLRIARSGRSILVLPLQTWTLP